MNPSILLNKPKPKITPKITKIKNLADSSDEIRKASTKLRKVFEKGTYQKKTQLSVLNRYKKRLDSIQKQNDKRFSKKQKVKIKLPGIKKFSGSLFSAGSGSDPLKSIAALAGFNALRKGLSGDVLGAIGPALVFAGLTFGPSLLKGGVGLLKRGKSQPQATTSTGKAFFGPSGSKTVFGGITSKLGRIGSPAGKPGIRPQIGLAARQFEAGAFRQTAGAKAAFPIALPGTPSTAERLGGASQNIANRLGTKGAGVAAQATTSRVGGTLAAKAGGVGARAVPLLGTALNIGLSAYRFNQGDVVGGILSALSAIPAVGWAALGVDLAREFGAFDGTFLGRKGKDGLQQKTEEQKKLVEEKKKDEDKLTFGKTLNRYEKVVKKFEEFSKVFTGGFGETLEQTQLKATRVENLVGDQDIIEEPGYEFTNYTAQYLTGDPNSPAYDESHGTSSNYHDHIAFKDREMAIRAYQYLESKGLDVTEFQGFDSVGKHSNGSYHYSGLAFDVPGYQWGATGPIDQRHYNGSRLVRRYLNEFFQKEKQNNPKIQSKNSTSQRSKTLTQSSQSMSFGVEKIEPSNSSGITIGSGGFNINGRPVQNIQKPRTPAVTTPSFTPPSRPVRTINQYTSYDPRSQREQVIPVTIPMPQQQMMQGGGSESIILPGPSEQDLLNSFYKRVLLNTVA